MSIKENSLFESSPQSNQMRIEQFEEVNDLNLNPYSLICNQQRRQEKLGTKQESKQIQNNERKSIGFKVFKGKPFTKQLLKSEHQGHTPFHNGMHHKHVRPSSLMKNFCFFEEGEKGEKMKEMYDESLIEWRKFQNSRIIEPKKMQTQGGATSQNKQSFFFQLGGAKKINLKDLQKFKKDQENEEEEQLQISNIKTAVRRKSCDCAQCGRLNSKQLQLKDVPFVPTQQKKFFDIKYRIKNILGAPIRPTLKNSFSNIAQSQNLGTQVQNSPPLTPQNSDKHGQNGSQSPSARTNKNIEDKNNNKAKQSLLQFSQFSNSQIDLINQNEKEEKGNLSNKYTLGKREVSIITANSETKSPENQEIKNLTITKSNKKLSKKLNPGNVLKIQIKDNNRCMRALANVLNKTIEQTRPESHSCSSSYREKNHSSRNNRSSNQEKFNTQESNPPPQLPLIPPPTSVSSNLTKIKLPINTKRQDNTDTKQTANSKQSKLPMESLSQFRDRYLKKLGDLPSASQDTRLITRERLSLQTSHQSSKLPQQIHTAPSNFQQNENVIDTLMIFHEAQPILQSPYLTVEIKSDEYMFDQIMNKKSPYQKIFNPTHLESLSQQNQVQSLSGSQTARKHKDPTSSTPSSMQAYFYTSHHKKNLSSSDLATSLKEPINKSSGKFSCYYKPFKNLKNGKNSLTHSISFQQTLKLQHQQLPQQQQSLSNQQTTLPALANNSKTINIYIQHKQPLPQKVSYDNFSNRKSLKELDNVVQDQKSDIKSRPSLKIKLMKPNYKCNNTSIKVNAGFSSSNQSTQYETHK